MQINLPLLLSASRILQPGWKVKKMFLSDPGLIKVYPCPKLIFCRLERYLCFLTLGEVAWLQDRLHGMSYFTWGDFLWLFKRVCYPCQEVTRLLQERLLDSKTEVFTHLAKYRDQRSQKVYRQMGKKAKRQKGKKAKRGKFWSLHLFDICVCIFVFLYLPNTMAQHSKGE